MYIESVTISNYKSFLKRTEIKLTPGINIIVGKNNSGKTALAEVLSTRFSSIRHNSLHVSPSPGTHNLDDSSIAKFVFYVKNADFREILSNRTEDLTLPFVSSKDIDRIIANLQGLFNGEELGINSTINNGNLVSSYLHDYGNLNTADALVFDRNKLKYKQRGGYSQNHDPAYLLARHFIGRVYHFRAERFNVGQSAVSPKILLQPDAANLPSVLNNLKTGGASRFRRYLDHVQSIFPDITDINLKLDGNNNVKIYISTTESKLERDDLDIAMQDSGTGIGQILAILYVVVTASFPRIFIIDEPQSFLHPGAVRKLFNILNQHFPEHQYIITTHSPTVIAAASPTNIIQLFLEEKTSAPRIIDSTKKSEMYQVLDNVGASLSDVFGADNVLWVEGKTEEQCFPEIINKRCKNNLLGTAIASVINKGDFEGKRKKTVERIFEIYQKLSTSTALIPPAIGFIFDRDDCSEDEINVISRRGDGEIFFLPRRMFENYLLNVDVIAEYILGQEDFSDQEISKNDIINWFNENKWLPNFYLPGVLIDGETKDDELFFNEVHGAYFLDHLFKSLSNNQYSYDDNKVIMGFALTKIILENYPEDFDEIARMVDDIIDKSRDSSD